MLGYSVRYFRLSRLLLELTQAKADGTYYKKLKQLAKVQMMVIDDWGLEALKPAHRNDLMEIMDDRHGHTSTVVISQLPTDEWYASIGDNTLADAVVLRTIHTLRPSNCNKCSIPVLTMIRSYFLCRELNHV